MDEDVDMDAPQISTLREEATPPPLKVNTTRRIKLLISKPSTPSAAPPARQQQPQVQRSIIGEDEGEDDEDDQEDQLIDDDDPIRPSDLPPPPRPAVESSAGSPPKKKAPPKRKPRKNDKRPPEEGRLKEKVMQQPGAPNLAPTLLWFEANPSNLNNSESHDAGLTSSEGGQITMLGPDQPLSLKISGKKKAPAKKVSTQKKQAKTSSAAVASTSASAPPAPIKTTKIKLLPPLMPEDTGILSEGMTGTAASSPVAGHFDDVEETPDPEPLAPIPPAIQNSVTEEMNLEGVPIPVYPLPTKPFPVLPPPKVGSGFAPNIMLDRSGTKVRHWRVAKREIRGIGGGRWFAQGWVGEKDSAFASQAETQSELRKSIGDSPSHVGPLKMPSVSAPVAVRAKGKGKGSSLSTSAAPSRSESQAPEAGGGGSISVHAPSKMRISQVPIPIGPSSEAGDSDMMGPPDS